jgi:hypothetical protein
MKNKKSFDSFPGKLSRDEMRKINGWKLPVCATSCSSDGAACGDAGCWCSFIDFGDGSSTYVCG